MLKKIMFTLSLLLCLNTTVIVFAGELHGSITWQYNKYVGTRGDTGADIWLCPVETNDVVSTDDENMWILGNTIASKKLFHCRADGYGKYDIYNIPKGKYHIWVRSENALRNIMIKDSDVIYKYALFTYYIKNPSNYEFAEVMMIGASKTKFDIIQIDDGPAVFSYDFGYSF